MLQLQCIEPVAVRGTLCVEHHRGCCVGKGEAFYQFRGQCDFEKGTRQGIQLEEVHAVLVLGREVDHAVGEAPFMSLDAGVEVPCQGAHAAVAEVHEEELRVGHAGRLSLAHLLPDATQGLRRACQQHLPAVGREAGTAQESLVAKQCVCGQRLQVETVERRDFRGTCAQFA